jgi:hypothetical protein
MNFKHFQAAVSKQFALMAQHSLYRTNIDRDVLWATYLSSFPAGSNPVYRVRTEHDCSCCRQFIRNVGDVVAIIDDRITTIWDQPPTDPAYAAVSRALAALVRSQPIGDVFMHYERTVGTEKSLEDTLEGVKTWDHFHITLPAAVVVPKVSIPTKLNLHRTAAQVFERALREIKRDAVDTVLELIAQGSLYRGNEHKATLQAFRTALTTFGQMPDGDKTTHVWHTSRSLHGAVTGIRNTSIGTLLVALSNGEDLEGAVKAFEIIVAPAKYQRPTALVTKAMVEKAKATVQELGLTTALERRYATLDDISINNVLFADRSARKALGADPFDLPVAINPKTFHSVEEVPIAKFLTDILPKATSLELLLENKHAGNLVSLIAPVDPTAARLFKWSNAFSWSYTGDVADSMKERVKAAGGRTEGDLCCRLAWDYKDDLDLHFHGPGVHIYFAMRREAGGHLDVDANGGSGMMAEPVENIVFPSKTTLPVGTYGLSVNNYTRREPDKAGFEVEIEADGTTYSFAYDKALRSKETVRVATITKAWGGALTVKPELPATAATPSRTLWGLPSQQFHKVTAVMLSPNHWDGQGVGNRHMFFMLDGCRNDGTARGFYNEFLRSDLDTHRKVLEMVGAKMRTDAGGDQLSGVGFSDTQRNAVCIKVTGAFTRVIKVMF